MTTVSITDLGKVPAEYRHHPKAITPGDDLVLPAAHLKRYEVRREDATVSDEVRDEARAFLRPRPKQAGWRYPANWASPSSTCVGSRSTSSSSARGATSTRCGSPSTLGLVRGIHERRPPSRVPDLIRHQKVIRNDRKRSRTFRYSWRCPVRNLLINPRFPKAFRASSGAEVAHDLVQRVPVQVSALGRRDVGHRIQQAWPADSSCSIA
jgi:hypothetical protein